MPHPFRLLTLSLVAACGAAMAAPALAQSALAGTGIAQVGVHHAWRHLRSGELKAVLLDSHDPGSYEMTLQYPHRALVAPRVRVSVEYLLEAFAKLEELHVPLAALPPYAA